MWIVAPVAAASRPWPETWSAWLWVSKMCSMLHAHVARELEVLVDLEARVDDRGDAGLLVADQVGGAAEVVVDDLAEDHQRLPFRVVVSGSPAAVQAVTPPRTLAASRARP